MFQSFKEGQHEKEKYVCCGCKKQLQRIQLDGDHTLGEKVQCDISTARDPGTHTNLINSFAILNSTDDDNLEQKTLDCDIGSNDE